jgi:hypothetical protein
MTKREVAKAISNKMIEGTVVSSKNKSDEGRFKWVISSSCFAGAVIAIAAIYSGAVKGPEYTFIENSSKEERMSEMNNFQTFDEYERSAQEPLVDETPEQTGSSEAEGETLEVEEPSDKIERVWYAPDWYESTRMSYMDYRTITCEGTPQWELQHDGWTTTDPNTGIRMRGGRYMIALGQTFGLTGTKVNVYLQNGAEIPCVLGDSKEWCDTLDGEGVIGADTGTVEFIVEEEYLPDDVVELGSNELQYNGYWQSPVDYIEVLAD